MSSFASNLLLGIALFTASPMACLAQLGANEVDARARYGPPRRIDDWIEPDERQIIYRSRGYAIGTSFVRGIVCRISYEHADATPLTAAEIDGFLRKSAQGSQWQQDAKDVWTRSDQNAMARIQYRTNSNGTYAAVLHIYSLKRYDRGSWFTNPPGA
jgi:hypothetical protein